MGSPSLLQIALCAAILLIGFMHQNQSLFRNITDSRTQILEFFFQIANGGCSLTLFYRSHQPSLLGTKLSPFFNRNPHPFFCCLIIFVFLISIHRKGKGKVIVFGRFSCPNAKTGLLIYFVQTPSILPPYMYNVRHDGSGLTSYASY